MRVAIDVTNFYFGLTNGTPVYLYNLARSLPEIEPELELHLVYCHRITPGADEIFQRLLGPRVHLRTMNFVRDRIPRGGWWYPYHPAPQRIIPAVDVFHAGDFLRPRPDGTPIIGTVLDLTTQIFPDHHFWANRWRDGMKLRWMRESADRVIAISESTKRDYVRFTGTGTSLVDVVPLAGGLGGGAGSVDPRRIEEVRRRYALGDRPYILTVGTIEPRKNHLRLIQAFETLAETAAAGVDLVLAGGTGWMSGEVQRALSESPVRERIHRVGFVDAEDLPALYAGARVFAYPSMYEGFGLPVLEAMAVGAPVLTSNVSSLPEIAGDAAVLVDSGSVQSIAAGLERLLLDASLRARLTDAGRARADSFTWRRTAELTLESYRRACVSRPAAPEEAGGVRR